jgi:hypothetical protein
LVSSGVPTLAEGKALKGAYTRFYPAVWNKLYRRDILETSGVAFRSGVFFEDVEFSHRLFPFFKRIASVEVAAVNYVQRKGSITEKADSRLFDYPKNFDSILLFLREKGLLPQWQKEVEYAASRYLLASFLKGAGKIGSKELEKAMESALLFLNLHFPHRKRNPYLLKNGLRGLYLLLFSPALARFLFRGK